MKFMNRLISQSTAYIAPTSRWESLHAELISGVHAADLWSNQASGKSPTMAEVRQLQVFASRSAVGAYKLGILYNTQALLLEVANALLKLAEEPPNYFKLVLIASADTFIPTLHSRLQVITVAGSANALEVGEQWAVTIASMDLNLAENRQLAEQLLFWYPLLHTGIRSSTVLDPYLPSPSR